MARPSNWQRHTGTHHSNRTYHCIVKRFAAAQLTMSCAAVFLCLFILLLWCLRNLICHVHHHIVGYGVAPYLGASLRIHSICCIGQLVQEVETFGCKSESSLAEGACERSVPYEVVGVHRLVAIATTRVLLVDLGVLCCSPYHIKEEEKQ